MRLYLMRHGKAVEAGKTGDRPDADRPLSVQGARISRAVAGGLAALGVAPDRVFSSPLPRACRTAEIVSRILGSGTVEALPLLSPGAPAGRAMAWLQGRREQSLLLVGHMPDMAVLASQLVCGHAQAAFDFRKSGVCCIAFPDRALPGTGCLEWLMPPKPLRMMARLA